MKKFAKLAAVLAALVLALSCFVACSSGDDDDGDSPSNPSNPSINPFANTEWVYVTISGNTQIVSNNYTISFETDTVKYHDTTLDYSCKSNGDGSYTATLKYAKGEDVFTFTIDDADAEIAKLYSVGSTYPQQYKRK